MTHADSIATSRHWLHPQARAMFEKYNAAVATQIGLTAAPGFYDFHAASGLEPPYKLRIESISQAIMKKILGCRTADEAIEYIQSITAFIGASYCAQGTPTQVTQQQLRKLVDADCFEDGDFAAEDHNRPYPILRAVRRILQCAHEGLRAAAKIKVQSRGA